MYSLAGTKNVNLCLFINEKRFGLLAKRSVLFYNRSIEEFDFICVSSRKAFDNSKNQKRKVGESQSSITLTVTRISVTRITLFKVLL
jgi:hypothetical protein